MDQGSKSETVHLGTQNNYFNRTIFCFCGQGSETASSRDH